MKTIKIWVTYPNTDPESKNEQIRSLVDFTFSERIVAAYYVNPIHFFNETQLRICLITNVGNYQVPYSEEAEAIIRKCVLDNSECLSELLEIAKDNKDDSQG